MKKNYTAIYIFCLLAVLGSFSTLKAQVTIYSEDFEGTYPWGMTTNDLTGLYPTHVWGDGEALFGSGSNTTDGTGNYASANSDGFCDLDPWDTELILPLQDFTSYSNVTLTWESDFQDYLGAGDAWVDVSTDGGSTWNNVFYATNDQFASETADLSTYDLTANITIRFRYSDNGEGCAWYWNIDDIAITGDLAVPCISPPTAGTSAVTPASFCSNQSTLVSTSITGGTVGLGQTYQWQSSPDGITWSDIAGAINSTYSQTISTPTYYRAIVTCSGLNDTTSVSMVDTSFQACYCQALYNEDCSVDYIANVTFGSINNTSTCGGSLPTNYSDYTALSTNVIAGGSYPISVTTDGDTEGLGIWIDFNHSGTFDSTELVLNGYTGNVPETYTGNVIVPSTALSGPTRMRLRCHYDELVLATEACTTFEYGETEEYTINIMPPPADDAGVIAILSPGNGSSCTVSDSVKVTIQNLGTNTLTSANINVSLNGGPATVLPWTGSIAPTATADVYVGLVTIVDGDVVTVWSSQPNGVADIVSFNDSTTSTVYDALGGIYTIGGTTPDFATLNDAVTELEQRGVCGPVIMNIRPGNYDEQVSIGTIPNTSAVNTVTFQSETENAADVTITSTGSGLLNNYIIQFDGASDVIINELTLQNMGTYSILTYFMNEAHDITVQNCILNNPNVTTTDFDRIPVLTDYMTAENDIRILNNDISGGTRSINIEGLDPSIVDANWEVSGNTFAGYYDAAVTAFYSENVKINNNTFNASNLLSAEVYRLYIDVCSNGIEVNGNEFADNEPGIGITLSDVTGPGMVANNFVYMGDSTGTTSLSEGIYLQYATTDITIANNSIYVRNQNPNSSGIYLDDIDVAGIILLNNNIHNSGAGSALTVTDAVNVSESDYNNLYSANNLVRFAATSYTTLAAYTTASGLDSNSVSADPGFNGADLHTCAVELDNTGIPVAGITVDFDGDLRNTTTPDIGADEFFTPSTFTLGPDILKCSGDSVLLAGQIVSSATYSWYPVSSNDPAIYATTPGLYMVQVTTSCGVGVDSVVVTDESAAVASFTTTINTFNLTTDNTSSNAVSYLWDFGDGNTSTSFEPTHTYASTGTYNVTLQAVNSCGDTTTITQTVTVADNSSINEAEVNHVQVYPNPSDGYFNVNLAQETNEMVLITIMDISGRIVYQKEYSGEGIFTTAIDIRGVASGTYILRLQSGNVSGVQRIIVK